MKEGDFYRRGLTDAQGRITFSINPGSPGQYTVTVTKHDYYPGQTYGEVAP